MSVDDTDDSTLEDLLHVAFIEVVSVFAEEVDSPVAVDSLFAEVDALFAGVDVLFAEVDSLLQK